MNRGKLSVVPQLVAESSARREFRGTPISDHPPGPDWVHPAVVVRDTGVIGLGLVATELIPKGATVILFGGTLMSWRKVNLLPEDMRDIPYQVADDIFFGVATRDDIGIGERINHSCRPNTGFLSEMRLVALCDIKPGEDVTMDYATCSSLEDYRLVCRCGERNCRGIITGSDWKQPYLQDRLRGYFQPYLEEKILMSQRRGPRAAFSSFLRFIADAIS